MNLSAYFYLFHGRKNVWDSVHTGQGGRTTKDNKIKKARRELFEIGGGDDIGVPGDTGEVDAPTGTKIVWEVRSEVGSADR